MDPTACCFLHTALLASHQGQSTTGDRTVARKPGAGSHPLALSPAEPGDPRCQDPLTQTLCKPEAGASERAKHGAVVSSNSPDGFGPRVCGTAWVLLEECMAMVLGQKAVGKRTIVKT